MDARERIPRRLDRVLAAVVDRPRVARFARTAVEADAEIEAGRCDAVSFGRHFLATPDLVARIASGQEPNRFDPRTLYTPGPDGYTELENPAGRHPT